MLMAVTVVSCTTPIFLLSDNVVPFFLVPISDTYSERGKIFVRNLTGMPDFLSCRARNIFAERNISQINRKYNRKFQKNIFLYP